MNTTDERYNEQEAQRMGEALEAFVHFCKTHRQPAVYLTETVFIWPWFDPATGKRKVTRMLGSLVYETEDEAIEAVANLRRSFTDNPSGAAVVLVNVVEYRDVESAPF